jgi:branched-chain amino acid transport system substrate-binding protein
MRRALFAFALLLSFSASAEDTIKIGLVTALSGQSARAGEAITRGLQVAIDELNAKGGVLGKKFELLRRDDEATPAKGVIAARELLFKEKVTVLFGGLDTPVSIAIVPIVNEAKVPMMGPWAAGTPITKNGAQDNYVFRVSAVDEIVDKAMLQYSQRTFNAKNCGMILVNNPWGESNEKGLTAALAAKNMKAAGIEKFEGNDVDVVPQLTRLKSAGADCLFLVGNVGPSAQVVKSLDRMAYDAMMLTALAIQAAGKTDGTAIRDGYYKIGKYEGLIKTYNKPFTPQVHDAVNENDYVWTQFIDNQIIPVGMSK